MKDKLNIVKDEVIPAEKIPVLRISHGCFGKCSYCVIHKSTGKLRSKPIKECIKEYKSLIEKGHKLVRINAEDTGNYGLDMHSSLPELFSEMLKADKGHDVKWIMHTMNPEYALKYKDTMLDLIKKRKIYTLKCEIQSGSNRILNLMNRDYDAKEVLKMFDEFKKTNPRLIAVSQFIVGFPSEKDSDFKDTVSMMEHLNMEYYDIFPYSDMPCSISSKMPDKVPEKTKLERLKFLKTFFENRGYSGFFSDDGLELTKKGYNPC
ncbi:radical SAM protein [Candidatus Woesearchaeota archaeon]|nr:radical SAM protein [Candidatus Woesearchaeota archaeon]